jgi:hypothetical protein
MQNIKDAGEAMTGDMREAAMRLGTAEMMLASASYAVRRHAGQVAQAPARPDTGEGLGAEGS